MTQLVAGWEEEKLQQGLQRTGSAYLSGVEDDNSGDSSDAHEGAPEQPRGAPRAPPSRAVVDEKGRSRSVFRLLFGQNDNSRESSALRGGGGPPGRTDGEGSVVGGPRGGPPPRARVLGLDRLSPAVCQLLSAVETLNAWEAARQKAVLSGGQRPTSGLQRWLVRLHVAAVYVQRLPALKEKLLTELQKRILHREQKDAEVLQQLRLLQTGTAAAGQQQDDPLLLRQQEELADLSAAVDEAIDGLSQKLSETAKELCSLAAVHLVYYELQGDIFGCMYSGEEAFAGMTLSRLLQAFPNTVEAFFCAAPLEWQDELASAVLRCLVEAWCLLVVDWGYGGHVFESDEVEVLEADLHTLRQYATDNEIALEDEGEAFDRVNDFLVMLDADGGCLAAAEQLARQQQQQELQQLEMGGDSSDRNRRSAGGHPVRPLPAAGVGVFTEAAADSRNSTPRRGRLGGADVPVSAAEQKTRRSRSKSKGWGGVGRVWWRTRRTVHPKEERRKALSPSHSSESICAGA
ncbi:uncharacterized protein EMH_0020000 [Eimeria mitis]|uniref:Uncharacterized protein n=1 Tax=Eimeria mitis TaxID=44415 RepID=U6K8P0_9EIME|nr:uncharacterized protein EMH_0020000 [Eimeria mitis]CDJ34365.1 hypothetical protein, conserved [Eimeria mitis]